MQSVLYNTKSIMPLTEEQIMSMGLAIAIVVALCRHRRCRQLWRTMRRYAHIAARVAQGAYVNVNQELHRKE